MRQLTHINLQPHAIGGLKQEALILLLSDASMKKRNIQRTASNYASTLSFRFCVADK